MNVQPISQSTRTRAQAMRDKVEIRLAVNAAGQLIAEVLKENGVELPGADWNTVFPNWLIATADDDVIGCCQVAISKPVGYLEFLFVRKSAPFKLRAIAIRKLLIQGMTTLHAAGCQYVGGVVSTKNAKFQDAIEKMHFVKTYQADVMVRRVA
jgi:hypothetical protein